MGAALACGVPVFAVGIDEFSIVNAAGVTRCETLVEALNGALEIWRSTQRVNNNRLLSLLETKKPYKNNKTYLRMNLKEHTEFICSIYLF